MSNLLEQGVALLGGTFDPVHFGHLRSAWELKEKLQVAQLRLVPCHIPSHRDAPGADSAQRLQMLRLALADCPQLQIETCELEREQPSYTIDTLRHLRAELGSEVPLMLAMGTDAFAALNSWSEWHQLLDYCHIVVMMRPGASLPDSGEVASLLQNARAQQLPCLKHQPHGLIYPLIVTELDISASDIREQIETGLSPQFLLPDSVWRYIQQQALYLAFKPDK